MTDPLDDRRTDERSAPPCVLVIFGATGDLTHRKLVPSLMGLAEDSMLPESFRVIGFARRDKSDDEFRADLEAGVREHGRGESLEYFVKHRTDFEYLRSSFDEADGYRRLKARLDELDAERGSHAIRIFYLATPPSAYATILAQLSEAGLSCEQGGCTSRVIIEKPFGHDLETAHALNAQVNEAFAEHQVFRIDHYLGKETVQNILALRFANAIFEPLWNEKYIDHVQITVAESIGVEGRGAYFEESGIIRDMIQNHLMQVLTLVAMEPPVSQDADSVRDEKVKVLRAIQSLTPEKVSRRTVRGQYTAGFVGGEEVVGYLEEPGVRADSSTETFAAVQLYIDNWRWASTPFCLRAGKHLPKRVTEIAIHFKRPPHLLYANLHRSSLHENVLLLRIQPDEGISLRIGAKLPGPEFKIRGVNMDFSYGAAFGDENADAYERLLFDAMTGDSTLFARRDEVEQAWRIVDSIIAGWKALDMQPLPYQAGSWGPEEAGTVLGSDRVWRRP